MSCEVRWLRNEATKKRLGRGRIIVELRDSVLWFEGRRALSSKYSVCLLGPGPFRESPKIHEWQEQHPQSPKCVKHDPINLLNTHFKISKQGRLISFGRPHWKDTELLCEKKQLIRALQQLLVSSPRVTATAVSSCPDIIYYHIGSC